MNTSHGSLVNSDALASYLHLWTRYFCQHCLLVQYSIFNPRAGLSSFMTSSSKVIEEAYAKAATLNSAQLWVSKLIGAHDSFSSL